ncbi:HAD family hydrolase [Haloglycomyces albus]|uniref:HAD family hydrolase n=1 Tax=Haloglycomyces albus TaxID=526067 RepID=UPI00046D55E6|nr:HAD-IA family hydrolase [Haloglycomyces albus]
MSAVILDFDGPVADVFAGYPASKIAERLVDLVRQFDTNLGKTLDGTTDPMEVLRQCQGVLSEDSLDWVETELVHAEIQAAESATVTPGAINLFEQCSARGLPVIVASNNAEACIQLFLKRFRLTDNIHLVSARPFGRPDLMKPHKHVLSFASNVAQIKLESSLFIGDSASDVEAGQTAGVPIIALANKEGKRAKFKHANATAVVDHMDEVLSIIASRELIS